MVRLLTTDLIELSFLIWCEAPGTHYKFNIVRGTGDTLQIILALGAGNKVELIRLLLLG